MSVTVLDICAAVPGLREADLFHLKPLLPIGGCFRTGLGGFRFGGRRRGSVRHLCIGHVEEGGVVSPVAVCGCCRMREGCGDGGGGRRRMPSWWAERMLPASASGRTTFKHSQVEGVTSYLLSNNRNRVSDHALLSAQSTKRKCFCLQYRFIVPTLPQLG